MSITLQQAGKDLESIPELQLGTLFQFLSLSTRIRNDILLVQPAAHNPEEPPPFLSWGVIAFLSVACSLSAESIKTCWAALKNIVWSGVLDCPDDMSTLRIFEQYGHRHGFSKSPLSESFLLRPLLTGPIIASKTFYPPFKLCPNHSCTRRARGLMLNKVEQRKAVYFTFNNGAIPAYSVQMYCQRKCSPC